MPRTDPCFFFGHHIINYRVFYRLSLSRVLVTLENSWAEVGIQEYEKRMDGFIKSVLSTQGINEVSSLACYEAHGAFVFQGRH